MKNRLNRTSIVLRFFSAFLLISIVTVPLQMHLYAQLSNSYSIASQMMRQGQYERALPLLKDLLEKNPQSSSIYENTVECLINLKRYDEAITITQKRLDNNITPLLTRTQLGKLYHIQGDTTKAYNVWEQTIDRQKGNLQTYYTVARIMRERREYNRAISVLVDARSISGNATLFRREVMNNYLSAGNFAQATQEMISLVKDNPDRSSYVQRIFMRYDDEFLLDTAILEFDDVVRQMEPGEEGRKELYDLQLWLLLERDLHRRAYMTARRYEQQTENAGYMLYNLAHKFKSERVYKLAEQAFQFYIDQPRSPLHINSKHKLADLYLDWADYLKDKSLGSIQKTDSLYRAADGILQEIISKSPGYSELNTVITTKAEIAIEQLYDVDKAKQLLNRLKKEFNQTKNPKVQYLEGRILLFNNDYTMARVFFTRAKKSAELGSLAEKARYYLSLTDFYAGDFEFAKLQLKSLERQQTSNYANDALQLRMWIQDGLKIDSTGEHLSTFADAVHLLNRNNADSAFSMLKPLVNTFVYPPLKDDAALLIAKYAAFNPDYYRSGFLALQHTLQQSFQYPLKERLMWERARLAELLLNASNTNYASTDPFFSGSTAAENIPQSSSDIITLYENLIIEFPSGFYASSARERLQQIENRSTS